MNVLYACLGKRPRTHLPDYSFCVCSVTGICGSVLDAFGNCTVWIRLFPVASMFTFLMRLYLLFVSYACIILRNLRIVNIICEIYAIFSKGGSQLSEMYERIIEKTDELGISGKDLGSMLGLKKSPLTDWKNKKSSPTLDQVIKMCEIFAVSADYLIFGKKEEMEENEKEILELLNQFDKRTQLKFIGRVEALANEMQTEIKRQNIARAARGQEPLEATEEQMKIIGEMADKAPNRAHDKDMF